MNDPFGSPDSSDSGDDDVFEVPVGDPSGPDYTVADGTHNAEIINLERGTSQQGNPQLIWEFKILNGLDAGKTLKYWTALVPSAIWKVSQVLVALGAKPGSTKKFGKKDVQGKRVNIVTLKEEYQGKTRSAIQAVQPYEAIGATGLSGDPDVPF